VGKHREISRRDDRVRNRDEQGKDRDEDEEDDSGRDINVDRQVGVEDVCD
jgi:hypothetical protein